MPVFDLKNSLIEVLDGTTPTPESIEIHVGEGTVSYSEKKNRIYKKDRGKLYQVMNGDEEPVDVSFDLIWEYLKADTGNDPSIEDALKNRGEAASWISTDADPCAPYCVDLQITFTPPCSAQKKEIILLSDFRYEQLNHNAKDATIALTGKCNVTEASITRVAQS